MPPGTPPGEPELRRRQGMDDVFSNHRLMVTCNGQEYSVSIRSFIHHGKRLYQAGVREDYHIAYQTNTYDRAELFHSLRMMFALYQAAEDTLS